MKKRIIPMPYGYYWWPVFILALLGFADSINMSYSHLRVYTDITYSSFCAISKAANCDTVAQSTYSILFNLPVPVWGVLGYSFLIILIILAKRTMKMWTIIFLISIFFSIYSIYLGFVSYKYIHSFCLMCFLSYVVSFAFSYCSWIILQRFYENNILVSIKLDYKYSIENIKKLIFVFLPFACICSSLFLVYPTYWNMEPLVLTSEINTGFTKNGNPWIGALNPDITIVEFTDYECFQCKKMHRYLRDLIDQYPDTLRLVHRHYPMDAKFNDIIVKKGMHYGAGYLSLIAIHAAEEGNFWKVNDLLYDFNIDHSINLSEISQKTGYSIEELKSAVVSSKYRKILQFDILTGAKMRITGTPTYLIEGKLYKGFIPKDIFQKILIGNND